MDTRLRLRLADGREVDFVLRVEPPAGESPRTALERLATDGRLSISDSATVALAEVVDVRFAQPDAPAGPGWGPGLQDEDAETAASEDFSP